MEQIRAASVGGHEDVECSIVVDVRVRRATRNFWAAERRAHRLRYFLKLSASKIPKQVIGSDTGDVNVVVSVVVVIAHRDTDAIHFSRQSRLARDVFEGSVLIIVIKSEKRFRVFVFRPIH